MSTLFARLTSTALLGIPLGTSALRFNSGELPRDATINATVNLKMDTEEEYGNVDGAMMETKMIQDMWPQKWVGAHATGRYFAHRMNMSSEAAWNVTHAFGGPIDSYYTSNMAPVPEYGIPALKMMHAIPGMQPRSKAEADLVTEWPSYLALASTWDTFLLDKVVTAIAEEFKTRGANVMLGPEINVHRATQHDENFDSLCGEDPTLCSELTKVWVLAAHNAGVMTAPKYIGKVEQDPAHHAGHLKDMWEVYYQPFLTAVDYGVSGVMCASHEQDGLWACRDSDVLKRDLKGVMNFKGMVISDVGAAKDLIPGQPSFERGLDLSVNSRGTNEYDEGKYEDYVGAVERVLGAVAHMTTESLEGCVPPKCAEELEKNARSDAHTQLARTAASSAVVLLKNDGGLLPLTKKKVKTIALLGPAAYDSGIALPSEGMGDYFSGPQEEYIQRDSYVPPVVGLVMQAEMKGMKVQKEIEGADVCVVIGGSKLFADHWRLDNESSDAVSEASQKCPKTVVLMEINGAVLTPWRDSVQAIMSLFHAGEETTTAWAATLFGDFSPSGKLPLSLPVSGQEQQDWWNEEIPSYWSKSFVAAYPFGHGLSYASFNYLEVKEKTACPYPLCLMVTLYNEHEVNAGSEVVQVYFKFKADHPVVLRAFHKTKVLKPGEVAKVFFHFSYRDLCLFQGGDGTAVTEESWVPQSELTVMVGSSSQDIRQELVVHPKI